MAGSDALFLNEPSVAQHAKMLRDRWAAYRQPFGQPADGGRAFGDQLEELPAGGIREGHESVSYHYP